MELIKDSRLEQLALKVMAEHPEARTLFKKEMFSTIQNGMIYDKIVRDQEEGQPLDRNLLISYLETDDSLEGIGDSLIDKIFSYGYEAEYIGDYARKLSKLATLRRAQISFYSTAESIREYDIPTLISKLDNIREAVYKDVDISDEEDSLEFLLEEQAKQIFEGDVKGKVKTGFKDFDALIGGFTLGDLVIIAGRTSMGKTSLMLRWILNMAKRGIVSEIYSYEMAKSQIVLRFLSMESGIPTHRLDKGAINEEEKEKLRELVTALKPLPLNLKYSSGHDVVELANQIRLSNQVNGTKIFAIDYAQLMNLTPGRETQDLNRIVRTLKNLAVELNVVIVLLSQLNRAVELRKNKRPMLSDLRQAGGLEESSDKVIFVYREHYYSKKIEDYGFGEILLSKNRNGPLGDFNVMFDDETTNFYI